MALAAAYNRFLANPDASSLADSATLNYITTTIAFRGPHDIVHHLATLSKQVHKKREKVLSLVHGHDAIALEIETGLEFATSGACYLPALDDNFLTDRTVFLAITHWVSFNDDGKILNIRQSWDQGALLKQLAIIGKTGRNWPIRDSKEQIRMIESCTKPNDAEPQSEPIANRSRGASTNALRNPHAALSLFESREAQGDGLPSVISPRGGVKPRQRDFAEILGDEAPASPSTGRGGPASIAPRGGPRPRQRDLAEILGDEPADDAPELIQECSLSPSKAVAPKAGAGKNFQPSRLFDVEQDQPIDSPPDDAKSRGRFYRPHPTKFNHFEFADGSDPKDAPQPAESTLRKTKHSSQWNFDDFETPAKAVPSKTLRHQEVHHWEGQDDEPVQKPLQGKARRDAEKHFEFVDDGESPEERRPVRPRGATHNNGLGLYQNNLYDEDGKAPAAAEEPRPLGAITNLKDRGRDFESHWTMTDNPSPEKNDSGHTISDDRKKAVKMMESNWTAYDESPEKKENKNVAKAVDNRGIAVGGDGMGGSKGTTRNWLFPDEEENQSPKAAGKKLPTAKSGSFSWDF